MTSHLYGRARNCYYIATRYNIRQLQHTRSSSTFRVIPSFGTQIAPLSIQFSVFTTNTLLFDDEDMYDEETYGISFPDRYLFLRSSRTARKLDAKDLWDARVEGQAKELNYNTWLVH